MENIFMFIKLKIKLMENTWIGNLVTTLSLGISMMGTLNELITAFVLISALLLNLSGIYKNLCKKKDEEEGKK